LAADPKCIYEPREKGRVKRAAAPEAVIAAAPVPTPELVQVRI
jgi:hypothetical protein